jgi:signal transduction histidine kinase
MRSASTFPLGAGDVWRLRAQHVALLLLLAASAALAWDSYEEHRTFAAHARATARQTATEAAGSLIRLTNAAEVMILQHALAPISGNVDEDTPAARARFAKLATHPVTLEWCSLYDAPCAHGPARYVFHVDLRTHAWSATDSVDAPLRRWIRDSVTYEATHEYRPGWQLAALDTRIAGRAHVVAYRVSFDAAGRPATANGLELDIPLAARQAFARAFELTPLLTTPVLQGVPNDKLYTVDVVGDGGQSLFRRGGVEPGADGVSIAGAPTWEFGAYTVRLALTPRFRAALDAAAGPPRSMAMTYVLFALCAALVAFAITQARREYELARLRESFMANVSHELRTPLAQIRIYAEALLYGYVRSEAAHDNAVSVIAGESVRLVHLVDNVLRYARSGRAAHDLTITPVEVAPVLEGVARRLEPTASRAGIVLDVQVDGSPVALADRGALDQIVGNLADNAVRYAAGTERVCLRATRADDVVRIVVEDHGPGIAARDRERIWDRFVRLDEAADVPGTGIGLSIVRALTTAMGGTAHVADSDPRGATFVIELPAA